MRVLRFRNTFTVIKGRNQNRPRYLAKHRGTSNLNFWKKYYLHIFVVYKPVFLQMFTNFTQVIIHSFVKNNTTYNDQTIHKKRHRYIRKSVYIYHSFKATYGFIRTLWTMSVRKQSLFTLASFVRQCIKRYIVKLMVDFME